MWAFPTNDILKRPVTNAERNTSISAAFTLLQAKTYYFERTNLAVFNLAYSYLQLSATFLTSGTSIFLFSHAIIIICY